MIIDAAEVKKILDKNSLLREAFYAELNSHQCTLNVLEQTVERFKAGTDISVLIEDIKQYLIDVNK